jgi:vitamin B12 transporter
MMIIKDHIAIKKQIIQIIRISVFLIFLLQLLSTVTPVFAQTAEEKNFLLMYFKEEELVVESPTRSPKPITQTAENVTVVTAKDIELMNAHTVADVLNTVTGVQVFIGGGPGSISQASIQGSENRHVAVFMDGIPLNNLSNNVTDLGSLPVQNIEKIEIIKGPASSAWGSALGGVVNIITKSGAKEGLSGLVSASYGEKNTGDYRVETSGKQEKLGYYVSAGRLQTDGFRPHNDVAGNNAYAKLGYDITKNTSALFTVAYDRLSRGEAEVPEQDLFVTNRLETLRSTFAINSSINNETSLNLSFWQIRQTYDFFYYQLSSGAVISEDDFKDDGYGLSAKLTWKHDSQNVVLGADGDSRTLESNRIADGEQRLTKWALFINDTMSFDRMSITAGVRRDHTNTNGDFTSPSLGMTYKITDDTLLRAYAAQGFSIPPLSFTFGDNMFFSANPNLTMEKVSSYQLGAETTALKYLWLKVSGFRHDIRDVIEPEALSGTTFTAVNAGKQRRQGLEVEMKTTPVYHTALSAGAAFINVRNLETGETVPNIPQRTYDLGLQYDDQKSFKALLTGHYIYWNSDPFFQGSYDSFIFDLNIKKKLFIHNEQMIEAFLDVHNIFNGSQYPVSFYKNPERWFEAGIRYTF